MFHFQYSVSSFQYSVSIYRHCKLFTVTDLLMMVTLNRNVFFATILKQQWCIWHTVFGSFLKEHKISRGQVSALAVLGWWSGFQCLILNESPEVIGTLIYWQILPMKALTQELQEVMRSILSSASFVKVSTLNSLLFSKQCDDSDAPNKALLVTLKWDGSRGNVVKHVFELYDELKSFLMRKQDRSLKHFSAMKLNHRR